MANIGEYIHSELTTNVNISAIVGSNVTPDKGDYLNIPMIVYSIISAGRQTTVESPVISIKCFEVTRDKVVTLNRLVYDLFDDSEQTLISVFGDLNIEGVNITNNLDAVWDPNNEAWFSVTDLVIDYTRS
jgi:hypothetical protein